MPSASPTELINAILDAISKSGGSGVYLSERRQTHPRRFGVHYHGADVELWIYIWTLTFGGRENLPNEYRVQMTSVDSPLDMNEQGPSLLMGYYPESGMLAGFDIERHREFTVGSPSVQIDLGIVQQAEEEGLSFGRKSNDEITVGIRPDHFLAYAFNSGDMHEHGPALLDDPSGPEPSAEQYESPDLFASSTGEVQEPRDRITQEVSRYVREARFRKEVRRAYNHRCAVTGMQLGLVDAAHILPVAAGGPDDVRNGICLSPTYHRAFDSGLIFLSPNDYTVKVNRDMVHCLVAEGMDSGISVLDSVDGNQLLLPDNAHEYPDPDFIRRGNEHRIVD